MKDFLFAVVFIIAASFGFIWLMKGLALLGPFLAKVAVFLINTVGVIFMVPMGILLIVTSLLVLSQVFLAVFYGVKNLFS